MVALVGCGRVGFDPRADAGAGAMCPGVAADARGAPSMLRVVVTADNGYTLVSQAGTGPLHAETPAWNPTSSNQIYFECEQYGLSPATTALYIVAGNISGAQALYVHAELDETPRLASSSAWESCDTGAPRTGTQPSADVAAFVAGAIPACSWSPATAIAYTIDAACACDRAPGVTWIWGATTPNWQLFRAPPF
jgi:hypothetical protein